MSRFHKSPVALLAALLLCNVAAAQQKSAEPSWPEYAAEEVNEFRIPMHDGVKLAASMFMPKAKRPGERFPVLLHTTPYCEPMSDQRFRGEEPSRFPVYFAKRGYVKVYLQTRGTCRSEGSPPNREYSDIEAKDS